MITPLAGDITNDERDAVLEEAARACQRVAVFYAEQYPGSSLRVKVAEVCAEAVRKMKACRQPKGSADGSV